MRIDKLLAHCGYGSRKDVKQLLKDGVVVSNGKKIKSSGAHVDPEKDDIYVDGEKIVYSKYVYYMLNKPDGYVSATEDNLYPTVIDLIKEYHPGLFPVGRLDVDTEGLLLITNDGQLAHRLLSPRTHVPKTYYVKVKGRLGIGYIKFKFSHADTLQINNLFTTRLKHSFNLMKLAFINSHFTLTDFIALNNIQKSWHTCEIF